MRDSCATVSMAAAQCGIAAYGRHAATVDAAVFRSIDSSCSLTSSIDWPMKNSRPQISSVSRPKNPCTQPPPGGHQMRQAAPAEPERVLAKTVLEELEVGERLQILLERQGKAHLLAGHQLRR